jgi:hypothetical protein
MTLFALALGAFDVPVVVEDGYHFHWRLKQTKMLMTMKMKMKMKK